MNWYKHLIHYWQLFCAHRRSRVVILILGIVLALMAFEEVADDVFQDPSVGDYEAQVFDSKISKFLSGMRTEEITKVMVELTALGSISVILTIYLIFVSVLISFGDYRGVGFVTAVLAGGGLWPMLLKQWFARVRPDQANWLVNVSELSFPSGHSFGAAAAYIGFAYYASLYARSWRHEVFFYVLAAALTAVIGCSRIYLGVHYPTDVLAGISGGVAWGLLTCAVFEAWFRHGISRKNPNLLIHSES